MTAIGSIGKMWPYTVDELVLINDGTKQQTTSKGDEK